MIKTSYKNITNILRKSYVAWPGMFLLFVLFLFLNFIFLYAGKFSIKHVFIVLSHPTLSYNSSVYSGWQPAEAQHISEGLWSVFATIVGASALALAALVTQALSRNPLADASTLGMTQSGVFGILLALFLGFTVFYIKFIFALIFGITSVVLLLIIITFTKGSTSSSRIILSGLAIGIIFKTLAFLLRKGDAFLSNVSYGYILGGAETINQIIGDNQWIILYVSSCLVGIGFIIFAALSRGLTLIELGEDSAKSLWIKIKTTKIISLFVVALAVPSAVMLLGNVAFIGLFSAHLARYFLKTRNYTIILLPTIVISSTLGMFGLFLSQYLPLNSGLWMTFIGAPYLIYAGIRGLR